MVYIRAIDDWRLTSELIHIALSIYKGIHERSRDLHKVFTDLEKTMIRSREITTIIELW